jgi:hypothetical protein
VISECSNDLDRVNEFGPLHPGMSFRDHYHRHLAATGRIHDTQSLKQLEMRHVLWGGFGEPSVFERESGWWGFVLWAVGLVDGVLEYFV